MTAPGVPLLPCQAWFLSELAPAMLNPARWNLPIVCDIRADIAPKQIEAAIEVLWRTHDALRARFVQTADGWIQTIADPATPVPFRSLDMSRVPAPVRSSEIAALLEDLHGMLDLACGPLARFVLIRCVDGTSRLVVVLHHLTCDLLSIQILGMGLDALLRVDGPGSVAVARSGAGYLACAEAMHQYAQSPAMTHEARLWSSFPWQRAALLPTDLPRHGRDSMRSWTTAEVQLPASVAGDLVRTLVGSTGADLSEMVMAAVAQVLTEWSGGAVGIRVVHHGRNLVYPEGPLGGPAGALAHAADGHEVVAGSDARLVLPAGAARTVGWLSSMGLVLVMPRDEPDHASYVASVRQAARLMPNHGLGISLARWDPPQGCDEEAIHRIWDIAQVMYNFLGTSSTSASAPSSPLRLVQIPQRTRKDHLEPRLPMHIRVMVSDTQLRILWDYDPLQFREETIIGVAERCRDTLMSYIAS